jgi:hypothetical protein
MTDPITTDEELAALPVGTVVECCWLTREDTSRPFGEMTKPVTRLFMVTEHMLVAERYEVDKRGPYGALIRFPGGIRVVSRPEPIPATLRRAAAIGWDAAVASMRYEDGAPLEVVRAVNPFRDTVEDLAPFFRDLTTGEPCPRRGPILCTITDRDHLHRAIHMNTPRRGRGKGGGMSELASNYLASGGSQGEPFRNQADAPCPTCSGPVRETVGMVCQSCGTDYAARDGAR